MKILFFILFMVFNLNGYAQGLDTHWEKPLNELIWGKLFNNKYNFPFEHHFEKSYALIIGVSNYKNYKNLGTENDPLRIKKYLIEEAGFDYVHILTEDKVTEERLAELMLDVFPNKMGEHDRFVFYWSGHGKTRKLYTGKTKGYLQLAISDTKWSSMIEMSDIIKWNNQLGAKQKLYLLDSCFSGLAISSSMSSLTNLTIEQLSHKSSQILTAGTANQETIVIDDLGGSVFTAAILDGLRGNADSTNNRYRTKDNLITIDELAIHIQKYIAEAKDKAGWNAIITPLLYNFGSNQGSFFFLNTDKKFRTEPSDTLATITTNSVITPTSGNYLGYSYYGKLGGKVYFKILNNNQNKLLPQAGDTIQALGDIHIRVGIKEFNKNKNIWENSESIGLIKKGDIIKVSDVLESYNNFYWIKFEAKKNISFRKKNHYKKYNNNNIIYQNQKITIQDINNYDKQIDGGRVWDWNGAKNYCENLTLDGFSNWELPTKSQLQNILTRRKEINSKGYKYYIQKDFIESMPEPIGKYPYAYFWTKTEQSTSTAMHIDFRRRLIRYRDKSVKNYVLCVRNTNNIQITKRVLSSNSLLFILFILMSSSILGSYFYKRI